MFAFDLWLYETGLKSQQNKPGKNQIKQNFSIRSTTMSPSRGCRFHRPSASSRAFAKPRWIKKSHCQKSALNGKCFRILIPSVPSLHANWSKIPNPKTEFPQLKRLKWKEILLILIIKVLIGHRVKHKMNLTFYVIINKGFELGRDVEVGRQISPVNVKKAWPQGQAFLPGAIFRESKQTRVI